MRTITFFFYSQKSIQNIIDYNKIHKSYAPSIFLYRSDKTGEEIYCTEIVSLDYKNFIHGRETLSKDMRPDDVELLKIDTNNEFKFVRNNGKY